MKTNFTDLELAELADWAEKRERETTDPGQRKAYASLRQGADWVLRSHAKQKPQDPEPSPPS